jgi:two-component system, cell cycle sensor histidine kinase and response regulator CckA
VVLGYADLLAGEPGMDSELRGAALEIRDAAERGTLLTGQLLAFGRKQVVFPEPLRLADAMARIVRLLRRVLPEFIEVLPPGVEGDPWIRADRNQVDQVLLNLAVNARDAMPGGGRLEFHARRAGSVVHIEVSDTGEGIPDDVRPRIFEPFFTTKPVGQGTGLGLSTVYGIVRDLGGSIDVRSTRGRGATFLLVFPAHEPRAGEDASRSQAGRETDPPAFPPAERAGSRPPLLVVEDDPGVARLCRRILSRSGHTVHLARSSDEALDLVQGLSPEERGALGAILCDVGLPGLPGPRLAEELERRHPELRGLPRLFISGYTASATALAQEGARVLPKPFTAEALLALVGDATARR